jgi:hypothetical protein
MVSRHVEIRCGSPPDMKFAISGGMDLIGSWQPAAAIAPRVSRDGQKPSATLCSVQVKSVAHLRCVWT